MNEYLEVSNKKNRDNRYRKEDVLSVSGDYGIVNQIEFQGRSFAGESVANYGVVSIGDVVYTKSPLSTNPYGIIKVNKGNTGIVSTLYAVYNPKRNVNSEFIQVYFELNSRMNNYMQPLVNKGAKNDMKVTAENALKGEVSFPDLEEQKAIVEQLKSLDICITLHQRKCDDLRKLKKYMLQKMFPQNGTNVPEIRFLGFTDAWEQRKYEDVIELLSGQDFNPEEYNENGIGIPYLTGASCIENGYTTAVRWTEKPRCIAEKGDTVLVCKGSGYGAIATVNQEKAHIARQFMALKVKKYELDNRFNYFLLNSVVDNIKTDARGLIAGIARDAVLEQKIAVPCLNEQRKIGEYFDTLDTLITLHQHKCDELKKLKNFMLQNMFV